MDHYKKNQKGFVAFFIAFLVMVVVFGIAVSVFALTHNEQKISRNLLKSNQAYYTAEAGVEDVLLRLVKKMKWSSPYILNIGNGSTTIDVSNIIGGSRTITSTGGVSNRIRKIQAVYQISSDVVSFHYGVQVGEGGLKMSSNSAIHGNVFSNGSIIPEGSGRGIIDNDAYVAQNGNKIKGVDIGGDGHAYAFEDCSVAGKIYYISGGSITGCPSQGGTQIQADQIDPRPMPISASQILAWKNGAQNGGIVGSIDSQAKINLGPVKINGNLRIYGNGVLTIQGTVWVTGDLTFENNAKIRLSSSYYSNSGVIIVDGKVLLENNAQLQGSGQPASYLMVFNTNNSTDELAPAFWVKNNTAGDVIFYASAGLMMLENNTEIREATAYKLFLKNNVEVNYQTGLQDVLFSSGPGGSWEVANWEEVK